MEGLADLKDLHEEQQEAIDADAAAFEQQCYEDLEAQHIRNDLLHGFNSYTGERYTRQEIRQMVEVLDPPLSAREHSELIMLFANEDDMAAYAALEDQAAAATERSMQMLLRIVT